MSVTLFAPGGTRNGDAQIDMWRSPDVIAPMPDDRRSLDLVSSYEVPQLLLRAISDGLITESTSDHLRDYVDADSVYGLSGGLLLRIPEDMRPIVYSDFWGVVLPVLSGKNHRREALRFPLLARSRFKRARDAWVTGEGRTFSTRTTEFSVRSLPF